MVINFKTQIPRNINKFLKNYNSVKQKFKRKTKHKFRKSKTLEEIAIGLPQKKVGI